jgi:hypothetical protein
MRPILTGWWFAKPEAEYIKIGISRGSPRGQSGFRKYMDLAPGAWFKSVTPDEYQRRFNQQLGQLDPHKVAARIYDLAGDRIPVLCCYERPDLIHKGELFCHRHFVAKWLEDHLEIEVPELDFPKLNRFKLLEKHGIEPVSHQPNLI